MLATVRNDLLEFLIGCARDGKKVVARLEAGTYLVGLEQDGVYAHVHTWGAYEIEGWVSALAIAMRTADERPPMPPQLIEPTHELFVDSPLYAAAGGKTIKSIQIKEAHVRPQESGSYPLAALLGCDTTGTAMEYGSHVTVFRRKGAAIVIGTIATVFGEHAARVAEQLVNGLKQEQSGKKPERLGEVMRSIKRLFDPNNILNAGKIFDLSKK